MELELRGEIVNHKVFGTGQIVEFSNNYITVLFNESQAKKMFIYPSAFGPFLELENTSFLDQIEVDKNRIEQKLAENKRMNEELAKLASPIEAKSPVAKARKKTIPKPAEKSKA